MADSKISALPAATVPLAGTEVLPIVQSSTTKQVSVANLTAGRAVSASSVTNAALTSGRVTYAGTSGILQDSANLAFDGTNLNVGGRVDNQSGSGTILTATSVTLFTIPTSGVYIVNATFPNFTGGSTIALVWLPASGNTAYSGYVILGQNSAAFTITVVAAAVVLTSTIGATATYYWSAIKLY